MARQYLFEVERLLLHAWREIRCDPFKLAAYGWPTHPNGSLVTNAYHTDADGVTSFIADPCTSVCVAISYWHHAHDAWKIPDREAAHQQPLAPFDAYTFGGTAAASSDGCLNVSMFRRELYTVGNWGEPQPSLPNYKAHPGYWGSTNRCLRRPYDGSKPLPFLSEGSLQLLLSRCEMRWADWQAELERQVHDPSHDYLGGHMITPISSLDPIFWLHHAGLDRHWTVWQRTCGGCERATTTAKCGSA